ncbi:PLP-dependent aminotransferase family protein [Bosea sp. Root381]|uniref:MocR-like pyridoxine biosynthesis transcription factor PdxR n=1 Tax=Bosea sp. Root381 TaxID=1736524 RepID=UPI0009E997C8|nr:PLP-dependent aminotransferase family protein [Bosea sp. Root381]
MVKREEGALLQSIVLDREGTHGLSVQICAGLRELILGGTLKVGERLPATRTLAQEFGVARTTIVESFERLAAEGLIETRIGSGTFVSRALANERPAPAAAAIAAPTARVKLAQAMNTASKLFGTRLPHQPRAFTTAMPAFDAFPMAQWAKLSGRHWRKARHQVLGYPDPHGERVLRQAIAAHLRLNRGIACEWQQIFVVAGAQQAFQLIAATLLDPGDKVWFEDPGAIGARNSLIQSGADLVPVPVDESGLVVEEGLRRAPDFRLAFTTPAHQQPLGAKMSLERRLALLEAAEANGAWIIEDDWDGEFCFQGAPMATLTSIDRSGRVIYVGTFSKTLFPSLRLGFLVAPPHLVEQIGICLDAFSPGVPTALQGIVADFIVEGHFATHVRRMRKLYQERYQTLLDAAQEHLAPDLQVVPTQTGMHTVAFPRAGLAACAIAQAAAKRGVTVAPISRFCLEPPARDGLVLGFSGFSPAEIQAGVIGLRRSIDDLGASGEWTGVSAGTALSGKPNSS